jgi:hypothetical protein
MGAGSSCLSVAVGAVSPVLYHLCRSVFGMGVADGVYMWKELGIDSGTMARTLMETCQHMVAAGCEDVYKSEPPTAAVDYAVVFTGLGMYASWLAGAWVHHAAAACAARSASSTRSRFVSSSVKLGRGLDHLAPKYMACCVLACAGMLLVGLGLTACVALCRLCWSAVLATAARHVESEGVQGSCTACLLTINKDTGRLQAATLGDSGFLIVGPRALQHGDLEVGDAVGHGQVLAVLTA